jgi:hypothetical protein
MSVLISVIAAAVFATGAVVAGKQATTKPAELSAELKVLDRMLGNWQGTSTNHKTKWTPNEIRETLTESCRRVLGDRFVLNESAASNGAMTLSLNTYDVQQKCYRKWVFGLQGYAGGWLGKWNGVTKTMVWRRDTGKDVTILGESQYLDDKTVAWNVVAKEGADDIVFHMEGRSTRVKKLPKPKAAPTTQPAELSAEQKVLDLALGNWKGDLTVHKTKWNPKEFRQTSTSSCVRVLGGRFILNKGGGSDGTTGLTLTTYDTEKKCYRCWYFDSKGSAVEMQGKWDPETKTATWRSDLGNGVTAVSTARYVDGETVETSIVNKDKDGEILFRVEGKATRVKKLPKLKVAPTTKPAERSAEQKVLDVFVGDWKGTSTAKAPWEPKAVNLTDTSSYARVLGGRFVRNNTRDSSGRIGFSLTTYDVRLKSYHVWYFGSEGTAVEFTGQWDAKTRTFTMLIDHGNGVTADSKVCVVDNDTFDWIAVTKDRDGKILYQAKGRNTRVKKPTKKKGD